MKNKNNNEAKTVLRIDMEKSIAIGLDTKDPYMRNGENDRTIRPCRYSIPSPLEECMKNSYAINRLDGSDLSQNLIGRLLELFDSGIAKVDGHLDEEMNVLIEKEYLEWVGDSHIRVSDGVNREAIIEKRVKPSNDRIIKDLPRP